MPVLSSSSSSTLLLFIEHLLYIKHCAKYFTCSMLFNHFGVPWNNSRSSCGLSKGVMFFSSVLVILPEKSYHSSATVTFSCSAFTFAQVRELTAACYIMALRRGWSLRQAVCILEHFNSLPFKQLSLQFQYSLEGAE